MATTTTDELILKSPDGTKEFRLKLENDGFLYYRNGKGEKIKSTRVDSNLDKPLH